MGCLPPSAKFNVFSQTLQNWLPKIGSMNDGWCATLKMWG